jgi:7-cyano-7-deazaguanine synthase
MRLESQYLDDVLLAADAIAKFTEGIDFQGFTADELLRSAILHQLMIMGEASAHISPPLKQRYPAIPWVQIKGFRNIIGHEYFSVEWIDVWETATKEVPLLRAQIARIIRAEFVSPRPAVCLLSGGLDSATCLAYARRQGFTCYALSFDYGQRHKIELESAARIASELGAERHIITHIGLDAFGGSALTAAIDVPKSRSAAEMGEGIPITYVPARNTIFLSFALAWAEVLGSSDIFIGVNALDYSGYPDCRPEFIEAYERMANLATKAGVEGRTRIRIHTPLILLPKSGIVKLAHDLGVPFALTFSCYDPDAAGRPCGQCDACLLRRKGFEEAGLADC